MIPANINPEAWNEWAEYRKAKRKPVTEYAARITWRKLGVLTHSQQRECIEMSISNDWQGLFPERIKRTSVTSTKARSLFEDLTDTSWAQ